MTKRLVQKLRPFLMQLAQERPSHLPPHAKLIVAVSGGPDSLALLHCLKAIYGPEHLLVAHLDHQLRPSAAEEAKFVQETAVAWQIACHIQTVDVAHLAAQQKLSLEEAGRIARYQFLAQLAQATGSRVVAVAHHANDQAETVLLHLLRGTGLAGLRGMLPIAPLPGLADCLLIRPFLQTTRAQIEAYCQAQKLQPIHDESNSDPRFLRNRLRHELLPLLAEYNPQIQPSLQQLAAMAAADYELIEAAWQVALTAVYHTKTDEMIQLKLAAWLALPLSSRRHTLRWAVQQLRPSLREIGFAAIEQARELIEKGHTGSQSTLPGGLTLLLGYQQVTITATPKPLPTDLPQLPHDQPLFLPVPGTLALANDWQLVATVAPVSWQQVQANEEPLTVYLDVGGATELMVRGRREGDLIRPFGMNGRTAKVKKLMINRKIPAQLRKRWPLVVNQAQIIWVAGHHLDEQAQIRQETKQIVRLQLLLQAPI